MNRTFKLILASGAALVLFGATSPYPHDEPMAMVAPASSTWGVVFQPTSSATALAPVIDGGSIPACIPYGSVVVGTALVGVSVVPTENQGLTIGDPAADAECSVTVSGNTTAGNCAVESAGKFVLEVDRRVVGSAPGALTGLCSAAVDSANRLGGVAARPRCSIDDDCEDAGVTGGTCLSRCTSWGQSDCFRDAELEDACAFVAVRALSDTGKLALRIER